MNDPGFLVLVILVVGVSTFLVTLVSTNAAIVLLIAAMLLSPEIVVGALPKRDIVIRLDDLLLAVVFFTWLAKLARSKELGLLRTTPLNAPLGLFILSCLLSTGWGVINGSVKNPLVGFFYVAKYVEYFLLYFMVANVIQDRRQLVLFLKALLTTAVLVSLFGYWQLLQHGTAIRVTAPFEGIPEPNTLAGYLMMMIAVCSGLALYARTGMQRLGFLGLIALMSLPFLFTYSRGGYAAFGAMYLTLCVTSRRHRFLLWGLLPLGVLAAPLVLPSSVFERIAGIFDPAGTVVIGGIEGVGGMRLATSPGLRITVWGVMFEKWLASPLLGFGVTGVGLVDSQHALVLGEQGLFGVLTYLWVRWRLLVHSVRAFRTVDDRLVKGVALGFLAGLVGLLVHSFAANIFIIVRIMEPFWLLAAMVMVFPRIMAQPAMSEATSPGPLRPAAT